MMLVALLFFVAQTAEPKVTLSGRVTDSVTHRPIADAQIRHCCDGAGTKSDVNGEWSLKVVDLEGGLLASGTGYAFGSVAVPADATQKIEIQLTPAAHISGHIVDHESGTPLPGFVVTGQSQGPGLQFVSTASGEDGAFTIVAPLPPGAYVLQFDPPTGKQTTEVGYGRTWYPGVPRAEMAAPIIVSAGENRDVELRIRKRPLYHVSGSFDVDEQQTVTIGLISEPPNPRPIADLKRSGRDPFQIAGLSEGSYSLLAYITDPEGKPAAYAARKIEITDHNVDDLRLALRPGVSVKAVITMTESGVAPPEDLTFIAAPFLPLRMPPREQQDLSAEGLPPAEYWPILRVPSGFAVTSVTFNERPVNHMPIDLQAPGSQVHFVLTSRPGSVTGTVRDGNRNAIPEASVALLPAALPETFDKYDRRTLRSATSDKNGTFSFADVAPGKYKAIALTGSDRDHSEDLPFLRIRMQFADAVEIDFGQVATVELQVK